ncbi:hypothetical protein COY45_00425 [Candidatus Berkelbacteria bacterium CG_4_10_14_0_8_um_filter_42_34]|uniref:Radical SAM core domain-containing protein n=1 Tax=Candidatus Berkelbacteria bacterium CG_4_10_14_0_8_um_filter_42_34 TaxID=1974502 RepID=A0A2M7SXB0_9BACT|nr:MAG: hypothetical protein COY45_00425 [Candidatus Berkelbacteria bacterium CG_4_10_14_0_8_um_filter_42_34]
MNTEKRYIRDPACYTGETDEFGFAFVPGNSAGVVLMDKRSRNLLDDMSIYQPTDNDDKRLSLLLDNNLIYEVGHVQVKPRLSKEGVRSISTWLHITNNCNLDCPYCYIKKGTGRMSIAIAKVYMDKLEETFNKHSLDSVAIRLAGGEPTLGKEVVSFVVKELYSRFRDKARRILPVIITNGALLDENWVDFIAENNIRVCFSLDGLGKWHDRTRFFKNGKGSFEIVFKNLELCLKSQIRPNILTTITESNIDGIEELNRYLVDNDLGSRYGVYRDRVGDYGDYQSFTNRLKVVLGHCYDYYAQAIKTGRAQYRHQLADIRIDRGRHLRCCGVGHSVVSVNHRGQVYLCQSRMNLEPIGNIWENRTLLEMAHSQETLPQLANSCVLDYNICKDCQWALTCAGGCPVVNADTYGTLLTASPYCDLFKTMIPKLILLKALSLAGSFQRKEVRV